jgi:hypothetical protein
LEPQKGSRPDRRQAQADKQNDGQEIQNGKSLGHRDTQIAGGFGGLIAAESIIQANRRGSDIAKDETVTD